MTRLYGESEDGEDVVASAIEFHDQLAALEALVGRAKARREIVATIAARGFSKKDAELMIDTVGNRGALAKAIRALGNERRT